MHFNVSTVFWVIVIFFYTVSCINNGCNNVQFRQDDLRAVDNQTYGFLSINTAIIGEVPSIFWILAQNSPEITLKIETITYHQTNAFVYFGKGGDECKLKSGEVLENKCMCMFSKPFVLIKAWSTEGPVKLKLKQGFVNLNFSLEENDIKLVNECPNTRELFEKTQKTYKDFRKYNEEWIVLEKEETVIWAPVSTFKHYIEIKIKYGKKLTKTETIGIEFNGQSPEGDYEQISKNLKIKLGNDLCQPFPAFFGYNRYISDNYRRLPLYYLEEEQNGPLLPADHLRNYSMTYTALTTPPLTSSKPSTTIADTSASSLISSSNIPTTISKSTTTFNPLSLSSSTTISPVIQTSKKTFVSSSTTLNAIEIKSPAAVAATPMSLKAETSKSEESGLSLEILIPLIIGCLLILLIIICIIVICIIRNRRRKKRQNAKNRGKQTRQKRSAIKNAFVTLVGEDEAECEGKEEEQQSKSIQKSLQQQQQQPSTPSSLKSNPEMPLQIHLPPTEQNPSTPASSNLVPSKEQASKKPDPLLPLQQTQSIKESEKSNSFDQTARAAKYEKRDPRFPHLIPGTIEFLVAQSQFIEQDSENLQRSGTVDDSKHAQFLHDH
uniref:Uncharacterized protein n=1 Tax=Panagrolaimus sp. PS1159 TaxID=55785 RepID=A0AC35FQU3_9BILA